MTTDCFHITHGGGRGCTCAEWKARILRLEKLVESYREELRELVGAIPIPRNSDDPLSQAIGQAYLVLQEGPQ